MAGADPAGAADRPALPGPPTLRAPPGDSLALSHQVTRSIWSTAWRRLKRRRCPRVRRCTPADSRRVHIPRAMSNSCTPRTWFRTSAWSTSSPDVTTAAPTKARPKASHLRSVICPGTLPRPSEPGIDRDAVYDGACPPPTSPVQVSDAPATGDHGPSSRPGYPCSVETARCSGARPTGPPRGGDHRAGAASRFGGGACGR